MTRPTPRHRALTPQTHLPKTAAVAVAGCGVVASFSAGAGTAADAHVVAHGRGHLVSQELVHEAVQVVVAQKGDPYVYGAEGPSAFDCSGLMEYSFGKAGKALPRTAAEQATYARRIPASQATRGDFAFYYDSSGHVYHVVMIAGHSHGQTYVLEAPRPGENVRHARMWSAPHFYGSLRHPGWRKHHPHA